MTLELKIKAENGRDEYSMICSCLLISIIAFSYQGTREKVDKVSSAKSRQQLDYHRKQVYQGSESCALFTCMILRRSPHMSSSLPPH